MKSSNRILTRPRVSSSAPRTNAGADAGTRLARQRRPGWIAVGATLVALAVLANVQMVRSSNHQVSVVRVARDVSVGQQIVPADVAIARVTLDPAVATVPGRQLAQVAGKRAAVGLRKGALLTASQLTAEPVPGRGEALVTVALKSGIVPPGLAPGWRVRVVFTAGDQSQGGEADSAQATALRDVPATVDRVGELGADGLVSVSLLVAEVDGSSVARQAAAEQVVLVVTDKRG